MEFLQYFDEYLNIDNFIVIKYPESHFFKEKSSQIQNHDLEFHLTW